MHGTARSITTLLIGTVLHGSMAQVATVYSLATDGTEQAVLPDGGRIIYGRPISIIPYYPAKVTRLDAQDQVLWSRTLNVSNNVHHVAPKADGSLMVHTSALDTGGLARPALVHLDASGALLNAWYYSYGPAAFNWMHSARSVDGMNLIVASTQVYDPPYYTNVLLKVDDAGNVQWARGIGPDPSTYQMPLVFAMSDGRCLIGNLFSEIIAVDPNGSMAWSGSYYQALNIITDAVTLANGNYLLAGYTSYSSDTKLALLELMPNGDVVGMHTYGHDGLSSQGWVNPDRANRISLSPDGRIMLRSLTIQGTHKARWMLLDAAGVPTWSAESDIEVYGTVAFLNDSTVLSTGQYFGGPAIVRRSAPDLSFDGCMQATVPLHLDTTAIRSTNGYDLFPVTVSTVPWAVSVSSNTVMASTTCMPLSLEAVEAATTLFVEPSLVQDDCRIVGLDGGEQVTILDMRGSLVQVVTPGPGGVLHLGALTPGVYFIRVSHQGMMRALRLVRIEG